MSSFLGYKLPMEANTLNTEERFSFLRLMLLPLVFFVVTPIALAISVFSLTSLYKSTVDAEEPVEIIAELPRSGAKVFASLPSDFPSVGSEVVGADARPELIRQYLESYSSPLLPYASLLVEVSDKYSLDWRLLTAIAQKESGLCRVIPPGSNNCWGWGIHSKGTLGFDSYEEGIETVSRGLKEEYIDKGYTTPDEIMAKYTPSSNGSWAEGVNYYMSQLE